MCYLRYSSKTKGQTHSLRKLHEMHQGTNNADPFQSWKLVSLKKGKCPLAVIPQ